MSKSFKITAARDGGYLVTDDSPGDGWMNRVLLAGNLADALAYIDAAFRDEATDAARGPARAA